MPPRLTHSQRRGRGINDRSYDHGRRRQNPQLRAAAAFRNRKSWRDFRRWFVVENPLCCDPFGDHARTNLIAVTQEVHHIQPLAVRLDLGLDADNCAGLCSGCHHKVEWMERSGEATQHLFTHIQRIGP